MINPWKVAIHEQRFEQATGQKIEWRKFNSGSEVIAVAGSSPIATARSRGLELELFWILEAIQDNEALVAHKDSGITSPTEWYSQQ